MLGGANAEDAGDMGPNPGSWKIPWRRKWQCTPVFLPGKFHGQRGLAGSSPWSSKELDTTEHNACMHVINYYTKHCFLSVVLFQENFTPVTGSNFMTYYSHGLSEEEETVHLL